MIEFFDSHCHLTDAAFRDDREAALLRAREAGVAGLVTIASTLDDAGDALALARSHEGVWCTAGVHPHEAGGAPADAEQRLREMAVLPEVVALGETGLDYHYDHAPRPVQRRLFDLHLALGAECGLPVVVHAREADDDIASALRAAPGATRGVLHCFTGGARAFEEALARGWHVSFSGIASFRTFAVAELLREVPADRLLVETDSPYLAPVPFRGKRNEPAFVPHVAAAVAAHLGESVEAVAARTTANARSFYGTP
ncbi:MAG: TatD family hydrolase [Longimicrobiales bacterium]